MKSKLHPASLLAITAILLTSLVVLAGSFLHIDLLRSIVPGQVKMQFNTSLCFIFSGIVLLVHMYSSNKALKLISLCLPVIIFLTGALTLAEYLFNINTGIDELFIKDELSTTAVYYAGRMSPLTALNFMFIGPGLLLLGKERTARYQFTYLSGIAFIALLMLVGFNFIADVPPYVRMGFHVVLCFLLLCIATWFAQPVLKKSISFERKLFAGFTAVLILMILLSIFSFYYNNKRNSTALLVNHTSQVIDETGQILSITKDFESGSRGYIITGDSNYLEHFNISKDIVFRHVDKLKALTRDNPLQQPRVDSLKLYIDNRISFSRQTVAVRNEKGREAAMDLIATRAGLFYMARIRSLVFDIQQEEKKLLVLRQQENNKSIISFDRAFIILLATVFVLLIIILFAIGNNIRRRKKAEKELQEFKYFFNNSNDLSGIANADGFFEIVNPSFTNLLGYYQHELTLKPFIGFVHPDDVTTTIQVYNELKTGAKVIHFSNRYRKKDGTYLWFDWNATPNAATGKLYCIARDITERKKAEDALNELNASLEQKVKERTEAFRQSEEQYRYLFQNNPMPMWVINLTDFRFLDVNEMAVLQYGYSRAEFLSMTAVEIRPDEDREAFLRSDHSYTNNELNYNKGIWRHRKKDGSIIQVDIIGHKILFEGIPARLILAHDVTEQQEAEEKLISNEKRFRALVEDSDDLIGLLDENLVHLYRSPAAEKVSGYTLTDRLKSGIMGAAHPEDIAGFQKSLAEVRDNPGKVVPVTYRLRHKNGHYIWLEGTFKNLLHDAAVGAIVANMRNVTGRRELETLLHKVNMLARIGGWEMDVIKGTIYWSEITGEIHEVEPGYVPQLSTAINFYKAGKDRDLITQKIKEAIEWGKPWDVELQIITAKNNERWIRSVGETEFKDGECIRVYGSFQDIDQRKRAEEKLVASELQFRSTLDNMLEGAQIIGFDWRYKYINNSFTRHSKYTKEDLLGYTVMEKFPGIEQTGIFKVYQRCFDERISAHLENEFAFPDGSIGWFELSFQPIPEGIFILSIDITERKKAEAAILSAEANYREIFEKASDAIYVLDIETGQILEINQRATEITGHNKHELIKRDPNLLMTGDPNYTQAQSQVYMQKAASGQPQLFDWIIKKADGTHSWIEVNLTKANIAGEERILSFFREINDRKKAQEEVLKLNEQLEQKVITRTEQLRKTNEELEAFSYSVSHDLRAPLRGIIGFTNILEEDYSSKLDDEARRITAVIKNNTIKMGNLIDDLLRFSQLGRQQVIKTTVDSSEMVEEVITESGFKNMDNITWVIAPLPDVNADPNTIKQVWINLISNAVKYSHKQQQPVIEIGTLPAENETIFFVRDNGVGFDEKYKNKLFKVFQRLHSAADFEGTGVGLAIVERIITKHEGSVWAEAAPGKGAGFYFSLPFK